MNQNRRQALRLSGLALASVLAGCSSGDGGDGGATTEDTDTTTEATTEETTTDTATTAEATTDTAMAGETTTEAAGTPAATTAGGNGSTVADTSMGTDTSTGDGSTATNASTGNGSTTSSSGSQAEIDEWLADTSNYGGSVEGMTGTDSIEVAVGASGNDGNFAFAPSAIRVSAGTTVTWAWTGGEVPHNVVADGGAFRSGDPQSGSDVTFEYTFDEAGTFLYYCNPHRSVGMKGAVVVE